MREPPTEHEMDRTGGRTRVEWRGQVHSKDAVAKATGFLTGCPYAAPGWRGRAGVAGLRDARPPHSMTTGILMRWPTVRLLAVRPGLSPTMASTVV